MNEGLEKTPVSVIVMTKNEEANIAQCLEALRDFAEVFMVDSYTDWEVVVRRDPSLVGEESQQRSRRPLKRLFGAMPARSLLAFLHSYVLRQGFRDGRAGFHYAFAREVYYWQVGLKADELRRTKGRAR